MKEKLLLSIKKKGPEIAIQQLNRQEDVLRALDTYDQIVKDLYWQEKDLPNAIAIAQAGMQHGLSQTEVTDNEELANDYRAKVKSISYNLASFTWPGWDEPGFEITPDQTAIGLQAAQTNLDLAIQLNRDALRTAYAHWMLAAQLLAASDLPSAKKEFTSSAELAQATGEESAVLLANGFLHLCDLLIDPNNASANDELNQVKQQFSGIEHGSDYINQLESAYTVFSNY